MSNAPSFNYIRILIYIGIVVVMSFILSNIRPTPKIYHLDGSLATTKEIRQAFWITLLVILPTLGVIMGSLLALIPHKTRSYKDQFLRMTLYIILIFQLLVLLGSVIGLFM